MAEKQGPAEPLFASLPMYDWPELAPAWDVLWQHVRAGLLEAGITAEPELRRDGDRFENWRDPVLILGQTCGWPYVSQLRDRAVPIGRFDFGLEVQRPGDYFSVFIAPPGRVPETADPRGLAPLFAEPSTFVAVNDTESQSGFRVLGECFDEPLVVTPANLLMTGSHRESIRAVALGKASLAAIDAVSWQFALRHEPAVRNVAVVARSADVPGLPLIVSREQSTYAAAVFDALSAAIDEVPDEIRAALGLKGVVPARDADYETLRHPPYGNLRIVT